MIQKHSIKSLYPLALAEGEGVGTAYEYFAKRLQLLPWLESHQGIEKILIAGLPEKYGSSLDFLLLGAELGASVTIVDERPSALDKAKAALAAAQGGGLLTGLQPDYCQTNHLDSLDEIDGRFDLVLSSETLQRMESAKRINYTSRLLQLAPQTAFFAPNNDNPAHTTQSGLSGLRLDELSSMVAAAIETLKISGYFTPAKTDYIDMPPFPPGITRSEDQREQATSGKMEAFAMWGLGYYAHLEKLFPRNLRRNNAHIVFALINSSQR